jgi:hypothetical protein
MHQRHLRRGSTEIWQIYREIILKDVETRCTFYFFAYKSIRHRSLAQLTKPFDFGWELRRYLLENRLPAITMLGVTKFAFRNPFFTPLNKPLEIVLLVDFLSNCSFKDMRSPLKVQWIDSITNCDSPYEPNGELATPRIRYRQSQRHSASAIHGVNDSLHRLYGTSPHLRYA